MRRASLVAVALGLFGTACASIISGSTQSISVNSNVSGAEVYLGGELLGTTPLNTTVERGKDGPLMVRANGYQDFTFAVNKSINTVFWVNILSGGVLGSSTDYSTGAMFEYEPGTFYAEMIPQNASSDEREYQMKIAAMRRFLLMNGEVLVRQLAEGRGTHLESLYRGLEVSDDERPLMLSSWREAYADSTDAIEFANRMIETMNL